MLKKCLIFLGCLNLFFGTRSQSWSDQDHGVNIAKAEFKAKRVISPSPEAATLGQYGNVPVSLFTGTPQINIPIYELKGNNISVPVGLSYNASGFKPNDVATWVGLYWSLNAGGVITRSVMANPDNATNYFNSSNNYTTPPVTNDLFENYDYMLAMHNGTNEAQPDEYYYNFGNLSGKFFIKQDLSVVTKEKNNLKISHCVTCSPLNASYFIITDEQGIMYEFRDVEISTSTIDDATTSGGTPIRTYVFPSSWYLSKITSPDGNEQINFAYYSPPSSHFLNREFLPNGSSTYSYKVPNGNGISSTGNTSSLSPMVSVSRKYLQSVTLMKNNVNVGYINFESGIDLRQDMNHLDFPGERLLQSIKAYSRNATGGHTLVNQHNFNYSYFTHPAGSQWFYKRLKLDNVQEMPVDGTTATKPAHAFEYNNPTNVPPQSGSSVDHWGFHNEGYGISTLVPNINVEGSILGMGADRVPLFTGSFTGILTKIKYPTGGFTSFEYELHDAIDFETNNIKSVGGLRVKKIIDNSFDTKVANVKIYQYKLDNGTSSGQASFPRYVTYSRYHFYTYILLNPPLDFYDYDMHYITISANSAFGLGSIQGSHIGYSQVTEMQTDISGLFPLGKTVYKYNIEGFTPDDDDIANGDLIQQSIYDNGNKLLFDQTNSYSTNNLESVIYYKTGSSLLQDNRSKLCMYDDIGIHYLWKHESSMVDPICLASRLYTTKLSYTGFVKNIQSKKLNQQTEKKYDQITNTYITTTKNFIYGNTAHSLPTTIEQSTTNNEWVVTNKKYPLDYTIPSSGLDAPTMAIKLLQDKNIIGAEIESVQYRQNTGGTNKRYISGMFTIYNTILPYPKELYRLETSIPLTTFILSSTNGTMSYSGGYKLLGSFSYNGLGNLIEQRKALDSPKAYIWDYNYLMPTAEISNAESQSVAYTSFETENTGNWNFNVISGNKVLGGITGLYGYNLTTGNDIIKTGLKTFRQYVVSYWTPTSTGAVTVNTNIGNASSSNGIVRNGWTYREHLLPANSISVNISASGKTIDELRLFPKNAQMATYTFNLHNGVMISQSSAVNVNSYFEYDNYNRLINVKDDDRNIVKNFKYNYGLGTALTPSAQTLFYNSEIIQPYTKNDGCPVNAEPTTINYVVPYGRYAATTQPAADAMAVADKNINGQAFANSNGQCLYWNDAQSQFFSKNDCLPDQGTSVCSTSGPVTQRWRINYTVPIHTFSSTADKITANNLAMADIAAKGQNYANAMCWCSCGGVGQKMIDGICETGIRYNSSTVLISGGMWQCTFYFLFSDNSVSQYYYETNSSPCPIN